jgi:hypothetical protein
MSGLGWRSAEPDPIDPDVPATVPALIQRAIARAGDSDAVAKLAGTTHARFQQWFGIDPISAAAGMSRSSA